MSESTQSDPQCGCTETSSSSSPLLSPNCVCPRDEHEIVIHEDTCLLFKNERIIFPHTPPFEDGTCKCCACPIDQCRCRKAGREAFDEWRSKRDIGAMPAVLESTHPLMQRFQQTLKQFLEKENAIAEEQILNLVLITEYESNLAQRTAERQAAEERAREYNERYKRSKDKLEQDLMTEREATEELEALTALCRQLESWRTETESDLTVSQRMSDKMRAEKRALADEKRQLDMIILSLSNEIWGMESKLEMFQKQFEIKNVEMDKVNDKVTAYAAELEDLELDKRRLVSLWNSVLVNIQQRDKVYDSVRDDYKNLQENYRTLLSNLEITKKVLMEEMNRSKELAMNRDKVAYDIDHATKLFDTEDAKRLNLEAQIAELSESIEMTERDQDMIKSENQTMLNILKSTSNEVDRKTEQKLRLENEILMNLQECLLNDKAVESMANGIKKMREMSRKQVQEITLMTMENQHAQVMLDIEVYRNRQARNNKILEESLAKVRDREKELDLLEEKFEQKALLGTRKQRELDIVIKKFNALKEIFDMKSPQERRIDELEQQIKGLRERTEGLQHEWLRLQGHVVKLTAQHHKVVADINLIGKQIQICEQKSMRIQTECENVLMERNRVERSLRSLRGRLEVLERTRKDAVERNQTAQKATQAITHEYVANLKEVGREATESNAGHHPRVRGQPQVKDAETQIIQLEEEIEAMDKEKVNLTQQLDQVQREALIWQRKGILAVELKKNIHNAKSAAGEIGQMKNEIHRMEQLRRTSEKLAEDLALYVTRRDTAMEKSRAAAAVEKAHGGNGNTSQSTYHHKLRLARADVARVTKSSYQHKLRLARADGATVLTITILLEQLYVSSASMSVEKARGGNGNTSQSTYHYKLRLAMGYIADSRLESALSDTAATNARLEEEIATLLSECRSAEREKQWLLERVVRSQRLGNELATAVKRQSVRVRKPKSSVIAEYNQARSLNDRLRFVVESLVREYPYLSDKFDVILNTLNIHSPGGSPRLADEAGSCSQADLTEIREEPLTEDVAEKPLSP
ncbi:unnamed protein product [Chilo suppressalis]|uniref:Coiled-coil domain-containing protein 40 n=1 Tax=Chilo suppressalis TaxID=168631 RepID=A0ABN8AXB1_CHISP|nr:unnamed protein product [Chilo suppressalis]